MVHKWHTDIPPWKIQKENVNSIDACGCWQRRVCAQWVRKGGGYTPVASKAKKFKETKRPLTNNAFRYVLQRSKVDKRGSICIIGKLAGQF